MPLGLSLGHGSFIFLPHQKMKLGVKHSGKCSGGALLLCVLSLTAVPNAMDQLMGRLHRRVLADADPIERTRILNQFFFHELGFKGNVNNYYDPDNSFIHLVLKTRIGIPISLGIIWLELANSLDLNACGIAFPGHFLCKLRLPEGQVIVDPFSKRI